MTEANAEPADNDKPGSTNRRSLIAKGTGAVAVALLAAVVGVALTNHYNQVDKFRDAKAKCQHTMSDTASAITAAAVTAYEKRSMILRRASAPAGGNQAGGLGSETHARPVMQTKGPAVW